MASLLGHLHLWSLKKFAVGTGRWKILSSYALYVGCLENEDLENEHLESVDLVDHTQIDLVYRS